jgi:hypothetical protein
MAHKCQIYLVPGFFGFTSLGAYNYFYRVHDTLKKYLWEEYDLDIEIVQCPTQPTSSLRRRALVISDTVKSSGGLSADSIHFIGHSTGGLDVRLLTTPGVRLRTDQVENEIGKRTKSVTTISTPHFGTPIAGFFTTLQGRHILQILTTMASNRAGKKSLFWASKALTFAANFDDFVGRKDTFLDHMVERLFQHISMDPNDPIWTFLEEVKNDQGAIIQLTPEGMHLFNAAVADREGVDYRCVVTVVEKMQWSYILSSLKSPIESSSAFLFYFLHSLAGREHKHYPYPSPADKLEAQLQEKLSFPINSKSNDGISPALSQLYGELIDVEVADHLDVVGQFKNAGGELYADWLYSGANFNEEKFQQTWKKIGDKIAETELRS